MRAKNPSAPPPAVGLILARNLVTNRKSIACTIKSLEAAHRNTNLSSPVDRGLCLCPAGATSFPRTQLT